MPKNKRLEVQDFAAYNFAIFSYKYRIIYLGFVSTLNCPKKISQLSNC